MLVFVECEDWVCIYCDFIVGEILVIDFEFVDFVDGVVIGDGVWVSIEKI